MVERATVKGSSSWKHEEENRVNCLEALSRENGRVISSQSSSVVSVCKHLFEEGLPAATIVEAGSETILYGVLSVKALGKRPAPSESFDSR